MEKSSDEETILDAIQPFLESEEKKRDTLHEIRCYRHRMRRVEFLIQALSSFFEQDLEEILKVEPVWKWLQTKLKGDKEEFLKGSDWKLENAIADVLKDLETSLDRLLQRQHRQAWRQKTVQEATQTLKTWNDKGIFVALLDKEGRLLEEPYPVIADLPPGVNVKVVIEDDAVIKGRRNVVARFDKPIKHVLAEYTHLIHAVYLCQAPRYLDKIETIKL